MYFEDRANYKTFTIPSCYPSHCRNFKKDSTLIDINFAAKAKYSFLRMMPVFCRYPICRRWIPVDQAMAGLCGDILRTDAAYDQVFFNVSPRQRDDFL